MPLGCAMGLLELEALVNRQSPDGLADFSNPRLVFVRVIGIEYQSAFIYIWPAPLGQGPNTSLLKQGGKFTEPVHGLSSNVRVVSVQVVNTQ